MWLEKIDEPCVPPSGEAAAPRIAPVVEDVLSECCSLPSAMSRSAALVVDDPDVFVHYPDIGGSWDGLTMDAFVGLTGGPAMADDGLHEVEVRTIERVAGRTFEIATSGHCAWGPSMAKRPGQHPPEPAGAAATLPSLAPRAVLFDMHELVVAGGLGRRRVRPCGAAQSARSTTGVGHPRRRVPGAGRSQSRAVAVAGCIDATCSDGAACVPRARAVSFVRRVRLSALHRCGVLCSRRYGPACRAGAVLRCWNIAPILRIVLDFPAKWRMLTIARSRPCG